MEKIYANDAESSCIDCLYIPEDELFNQVLENLEEDGARLIAPSCTILEQIELSDDEIKSYSDGFEAALDGVYPLEHPYLDLNNRTVYSIDMVRLDFEYDDAEKLTELIDTQMVLSSMSTYTSNRIGTYRFMWSFDYANGKDGGYYVEKQDEVITDGGDKGVVLKCGYGVVGKGGKHNNRGFVEFNPNKMEKNGRRFLDMLSSFGCIFELSRYDIAIDVPIPRNSVRVVPDRRKYEYVSSGTGGITEYLGVRSNPGRVKVYDKAGEQELDTDLTRIELTCRGNWGHDAVMEKLPVLPDFSGVYKGSGPFAVVTAILADMLGEHGDDIPVIPDKYARMLPRNTMSRWRKKWKESEVKAVKYDEACVIAIMQRARSFIPK